MLTDTADAAFARRRTRLAHGLVSALIGVGFGLRLFWALTIAPEQVSDARTYLGIAGALAVGDGYRDDGLPSAYYPIGYPAALASFFWLFGASDTVARVANALFGAVSLWSLFSIARALTGSLLAAGLALLVFAFYPADIAYTSITLSQLPFNTFLLAGCACCLVPEPKSWRVSLGGALLGVATLTRNQGAALPVLIALGWLLQRPWTQRRRHALLLIAAFVATLAPWTIRNALAFDAFVPVSNNGGINLYIGNNPVARGRYKYSRKLDAQLTAGIVGPRLGGRNEVWVDRNAARLAWRYVWDHPRAALALWRPKFDYLYGDDGAPFGFWSRRVPDERQARQIERAKQFNSPFYPLLLWLAGLGAVAAAWEFGSGRRPFASLLWLPAIVIAIFTALHLLTFGDPCHHHPMMPWFAIYAGYGAAAAWRWLRALPIRRSV